MIESAEKALLLTDLVGSTALAESLGELRLAELMARHDRLARDLVAHTGGVEIDKSDGFLLLFDEVERAASFAIGYHAALAELASASGLAGRFSARAGIHVGPVTLRRNPASDVQRGAKPLEVEGVAKAIAARAMSVALGGQTLLTGAAFARLGPISPERVVQEHGLFKFKGVTEPISLIELGSRGAAPLIPPPDGEKVYRVVKDDQGWRPARETPTNLPAEKDLFFGRGTELRELFDRLEEGARFISVLGPPGTGKTRLARRFASQWRGDFPGGVWLCDFTEATGLDDLCRVVRSTLNIPAGDGDPVAQLGRALKGRPRTLLLADNFEHLVELAQATLARWLAEAPSLVVLATSRVRFRLAGEYAFDLQPLPLPPPEQGPAVLLFEARARQLLPSFELNAQNLSAVSEIVRRLDGLPLAIELAAARVRSMSPALILERLSQRFRLLVSGQRDGSRQATLRGAIDWTWDLCTPDEQRAAAYLSVFRGGFDLESAEAVIGDDPQAPPAFELVEALADKSLLRIDRAANGPRFGMYESIREYLTEKLGALQDATLVRDRHAAHFARAYASAQPRLGVKASAPRFALRELDNLRSAQAWAQAQGLPQAGPLTVSVSELLTTVGQWQQALVMLDACHFKEPALRAEALACKGNIEADAGREPQGVAALQESIALADAAGERVLQAVPRARLSWMMWRAGKSDEASALVDEALARLPGGANPLFRADVALLKGIHEAHSGRFAQAAPYYEGFVAAAEAAQEPLALGRAYSNLAIFKTLQGLCEEAVVFNKKALGIAREFNLRNLEVGVASNLAQDLLGAGRFEEAQETLLQTLSTTQQVGAYRAHLYCVNLLIVLLLGEQQTERAAALCRIEAEVLQTDRRQRVDYLGGMACVAAAQGRLDDARKWMEEVEREAAALHDQELRETTELRGAWVDAHAVRLGVGERSALVDSVRRRCAHPPAWLRRFAAQALALVA